MFIVLDPASLGKCQCLCKLHSSFMSESLISLFLGFEICEHSLLSDGSGSLISPNYPQNLPDNLDCTASISVIVGTLIYIEIIDIDLEFEYSSWNRLRCHDILYVSANCEHLSCILSLYNRGQIDFSRSVKRCERQASILIFILNVYAGLRSMIEHFKIL